MQWKKQYVLGVASNGPVHLAAPLDSSAVNVAVKSAEVETSSALREEGKILNELKGSPYIVQCFGEDESVEHGKMMYNLLLEYAPHGTLRDVILFHRQIPEPVVARYAYQLLMGIHHVHSKGFFHCDIKLSNILVFSTNRLIKIADFGSALRVPGAASQVFDVCSIGCVVVKMLTGDPTWHVEHIEKYQGELFDFYAQVFLGSVSEMAKDFVINCLLCHDSGRLTVDVNGLIKHPFIQNAITITSEKEEFNNNPFGDWVSKNGLFTTSCDDNNKSKIKEELGHESIMINAMFASKEFMEMELNILKSQDET